MGEMIKMKLEKSAKTDKSETLPNTIMLKSSKITKIVNQILDIQCDYNFKEVESKLEEISPLIGYCLYEYTYDKLIETGIKIGKMAQDVPIYYVSKKYSDHMSVFIGQEEEICAQLIPVLEYAKSLQKEYLFKTKKAEINYLKKQQKEIANRIIAAQKEIA